MQTVKRLRGTTLQNLRKAYFEKHPLCVVCYKKNVIRAATELDHIIPLCKGGTNEDSNYQGLCYHCHKEKSAKDAGHVYAPKRAIGADGWPI